MEVAGAPAPAAAGDALDPSIYRRLVELAPDPMIAHARGRVVLANEAAARLMGCASAAEMIGRAAIDFVAPESRALASERIRRMLATGATAPLASETFLTVDGRRVAVEVTATPAGGDVVLVVARNVQPRVEEEHRRAAVESRFRAFFEASRDAMGISKRGVHVLVNPAYARLFGYGSPEELVGLGILELIAPEEHARVREFVGRRAEHEEVPPAYTVRARRRDGSPFEMDVRASGYEEGGEVYTVVVLRDVTAERADAARVAQSEARYRELFESIPVGVWVEDLSGAKAILDRLGCTTGEQLRRRFADDPGMVAACAMAVKVVDANPTACAMAGARDFAELSQNLHKIFLPESLPDFAEELAGLLEGRRRVVVDGWNGTIGGERRWVAVGLEFAPGHERDWARVLVTTIDTTERKQANEERAALRERLREAEKLEAIGRLAGGVAHDFNNLLAAVLGFAETSLLEAAPGSSIHEAQVRIREAALRARDLVRQILAFGKRDRPAQRPVDLGLVVKEALPLVRASIPSSVALIARVDARAGVVLADPSQLHQIVLNLCSNARDAVGGSGTIEVTVEPVDAPVDQPGLARGRWVRLRVKDDGAGIDEATRQRLFEPYMTTKAEVGGHGLGLAVVHGIVTAAGGEVLVQSAPGLGSTFDVYLPRIDASAPPPPPDAKAVPRGRERILLVDDDPLVRAVHRRLLSSLGYEVHEAVDGDEALDRIKASPKAFDLVLTDQTMPRLTGANLARAVLAQWPGLRIVLCSGYSDAVDEAQARALGIRALLGKPIERATLAATLRRVLDEP